MAVVYADNFPGPDALRFPSRSAQAVTPSDTDDLVLASKAIYIGGAGNLKVNLLDGTTVTFTSLAAGTLLPIRATRVYATNTTATLIIALQ